MTLTSYNSNDMCNITSVRHSQYDTHIAFSQLNMHTQNVLTDKRTLVEALARNVDPKKSTCYRMYEQHTRMCIAPHSYAINTHQKPHLLCILYLHYMGTGTRKRKQAYTACIMCSASTIHMHISCGLHDTRNAEPTNPSVT